MSISKRYKNSGTITLFSSQIIMCVLSTSLLVSAVVQQRYKPPLPSIVHLKRRESWLISSKKTGAGSQAARTIAFFFFLEFAVYLPWTSTLRKTQGTQHRTERVLVPWTHQTNPMGVGAALNPPWGTLKVTPFFLSSGSSLLFPRLAFALPLLLLRLYAAGAPADSYIRWWRKLLCVHTVPAPRSPHCSHVLGEHKHFFFTLGNRTSVGFKAKDKSTVLGCYRLAILFFFTVTKAFPLTTKSYFTFQNCSHPVKISTCGSLK